MASSSDRVVNCPACRGESVYGPPNPYRPFCSRRCQSLDFGAWADESFRLPAKPPEVDEAFDDPAGPPPVQ